MFLNHASNVHAGLFTGIRDERFDFSLLLPLHLACTNSKTFDETQLKWFYAPECIFHNQHKTLYMFDLFSSDPAVSCVVDKQVSHGEIYTLCSILLHSIFFLSHGCVHMGHLDFLTCSSSFVRLFCKTI